MAFPLFQHFKIQRFDSQLHEAILQYYLSEYIIFKRYFQSHPNKQIKISSTHIAPEEISNDAFCFCSFSAAYRLREVFS